MVVFRYFAELTPASASRSLFRILRPRRENQNVPVLSLSIAMTAGMCAKSIDHRERFSLADIVFQDFTLLSQGGLYG